MCSFQAFKLNIHEYFVDRTFLNFGVRNAFGVRMYMDTCAFNSIKHLVHISWSLLLFVLFWTAEAFICCYTEESGCWRPLMWTACSAQSQDGGPGPHERRPRCSLWRTELIYVSHKNQCGKRDRVHPKWHSVIIC